jgi:hypothetical protein
METYGDLRKAIKLIILKQKGAAIGKVAVDVVLNTIPGVGAAKNTFDFIKASFNKPDTKKTKTWLDKIDVDDDMSDIVDDTVENGFLEMMVEIIESQPDDKPLEPDFNMNQELVDYLKKNYHERTITGIKEMEDNKTIQRMKELAGISSPEKETPAVKNIDKDLADRGSDFKLISTKDKLVELLDTIVNQLDPKFKESPAFKTGVREFFTKYK